MHSRILTSLVILWVCLAALLRSVNTAGSRGIFGGMLSSDNVAPGIFQKVAAVVSTARDITHSTSAISHSLRRIFTDEESGTNPLNYDGGNIGAYYNFMYPDNDDYPWSCVCSEKDFQLYQEKKMPYVRCRNQEDLSFHDFQANCDPKNSSNKPY